MASEEIVIGVAVTIPDPYGAELSRWRADLGDAQAARTIPPHVTLLPPTTIDTSILGEVHQHLEQAAESFSPFEMRLRGAGTFRPVSPVVFVQVAEGLSECEQLERRVRSGVLHRELSFYYHPHVTVAHHLPEDNLDRAFEELADYDARFVVPVFDLYEHGADEVWRPSRSFTLGG